MSLPSVFVRRMREEDLAVVMQLHLDSWRRSYAGLMPDAFLAGPVEIEMQNRWAQMPASHDVALVAERSGAVVGFALVYTTHPDGPLMESLHVAAAAQGQGIGRQLMQAVAQALQEQGKHNMWLEVITGNRTARKTYARWGGVESWPFKDIIAGQEVMAVKVRWGELRPLLPDDAEPMRGAD